MKTKPNPFLAFVMLSATALLASQSAQALTYDWSGNTSGNMSGTTDNWGGTVPTGTDVARWNAASYTNAPSANAGMTIGELLFDAGNTAGVTFGAGTSTLTLNGISGVGIQLNNGSGAVSAGSAKFSLGGDQTWLNNSANTFTVPGTITNASNSIPRTLTLDGSGSTILSGVISNNSTGTTTITKTGSGTLTLGSAGANTFTGGLNVQQGTVKLTGSNSQGAGAGLVTIGSSGNSAILDLNGASKTIHSLATAGTAANQTITNSAASAATVNLTGAATSTFGGVIENGSGGSTTALTLNNASANLTLTGANTYTGATIVTAGTLKVGASNAIVSGNALTTGASGIFDLNGFDQTIGTLNNGGNITNSGVTTKTFSFGSPSSSVGAGSFTGALNVIVNVNTNVITLTGSWSNTGNITLNGVTTNTITLSTGTVNNTGTITTTGVASPTTISANIGANVGLITQSNGGTLTLSGTNTNVGGVNLTTGTLKLGSTTALGATASTLTIAGGTTLDSTVSNLALANNNAQNWNGNFTFTGTQSLNLGTGAVTLAAPLTLAVSANTLTFGGTISGGTIFDITKAGAGTLVYNGNVALTSNQTLNISAGSVVLGGTVSGGFGITVNGAGTLGFGSAAAAAASPLTGNGTSSIRFDSSTPGVTGVTRAASVTLKGSSLSVIGNSTSNTVDTITGALTVDAPSTWGGAGANMVSLTADPATNTRLTAGSLVRVNNGAVFFRGTSLGANTIASNTAGTSNIEFTSAPTAQLVGGGGAAGTKNISIIPWAVGAITSGGLPTSFVTYDANGIRPLASGEYETVIPAAAVTNNVKLDAATPVTSNDVTTINSLLLNNAAGGSTTALAGTGALTITSGAIFADMTLGGNNNVTVISKPIDFAGVTGLIGTMGTANSKTLSFATGGGISGSAGVMIYDTGTVSSTQAGVSFGVANTYTGDTIVNGSLLVGTANALPNFTHAPAGPGMNRTGNVYVNGNLSVSNTVRMNGLFGNGRIITPFSTNATVLVGDGDSTSTFGGTIAQTSGTITFTKIGAGTLTLTGTNNTYTNVTKVENGTLSVVTLNSIVAPAASSTLGKPTTVAGGTIGLGTSSTTGTLKVVGTGETTDRVINLAGTTGGGTIEQAGTGLLKFTGDFTATGNGLKVLTLTGSTAGTGEIAGAIVNSTSATSVAKSGTGTWTLSGINSYTGSTTVSGGTLRLATATLDDASIVEVASTAVLNLTHGGTDVVAEFRINGIPQGNGTFNASNTGGRITGSGSLQVGAGSDPFVTWIDSFTSLTNPADKTRSADPDKDGQSNFVEFALDGNPASGADTGKVRSRVETVGADQALVITLPVRAGAVFDNIPGPSADATIENLIYNIAGSNDLAAFDQGVTEIAVSASGMPALSSASWTYRTFRLNGAVGGVTPRGPKGFLRVVLTSTP